MGRIVVQFWDCKHCGTKAIRGSERDCPNCGNARDEDVTFYMDPHNPQYVSIEEAKNVTKKPDWICPFCNNLNSDNVTNCTSCGSLRTDENETYTNFNHIYFTSNGIERSSEDRFDEIVNNDTSTTSSPHENKNESFHSDNLKRERSTYKGHSNSIFDFFYDNRKAFLSPLLF